MSVKVRNIEVKVESAELLEARAAARGLSVSELLADLLGEGRCRIADVAIRRERAMGT